MSKFKKFIGTTLLALAAITLSIGPVSAHGTLVSMTPAIDSVVTTAPSEIVLTFDENVSPIGYGITVTAPDGTRVDVGSARVTAAELSVKLGPITLNGHYLVNYRIVSDDGHPVEVSTGFAVKIPGLSTTTKPEIDATGEGGSGIEQGEGRQDGDGALVNIFYLLLAAFIGGLYVYSLRRNKRRKSSAN